MSWGLDRGRGRRFQSSAFGFRASLTQGAVCPNMLWCRFLIDVPLRLVRPGSKDRPRSLAVRRASRISKYVDEAIDPATGRHAGGQSTRAEASTRAAKCVAEWLLHGFADRAIRFPISPRELPARSIPRARMRLDNPLLPCRLRIRRETYLRLLFSAGRRRSATPPTQAPVAQSRTIVPKDKLKGRALKCGS